MADLVAVDARKVGLGNFIGENYPFWETGVSVIRYRTDIPSKPFAARRNKRSVSASSFLCDSVKFRWRDGFIRSFHTATARNSASDIEQVSVDVVGEVAGCVVSSLDIGIIR